ncbi:MAG: VOC family protein [Glaciihabitans sp.]
MTVSQLRLVVEAEDYDEAVRFYREALGLPELASYSGEGDARVTILQIPSATLEIANPAQVRMIDDVEVGRPVARRSTLSIRVAFEVDDAAAVTNDLESAGAEVIASPTLTPWNSVNSRLETPGGLQVTVFQEVQKPDENPPTTTGRPARRYPSRTGRRP